MKRTPFILPITAAIVAGVSPMASSLAKQQCWAEAPPNIESHWSYRIIDGRKCWYEGKPMLSRSLLEWPTHSPQAAATPDKATAPDKTVASAPNQTDGFEARWRDRFLDAMGKY